VSPDPDFSLTLTDPVDGAVRLIVRGELDLATTPDLVEALARLREEGREVLLDLGDLAFIDSTGLSEIVRAAEAFRDGDGCSLRITPGGEHVMHVFDLAGLVEILPFVDRS
jgi:anti-sigma B factor antagonist